jgi:hypothetical protein
VVNKSTAYRVQGTEKQRAEGRDILSLQPDNPVARSGLTYALFVQGMFEEALAEDRKKLAAHPERLDALEQGYAEAIRAPVWGLGCRLAERNLFAVSVPLLECWHAGDGQAVKGFL